MVERGQLRLPSGFDDGRGVLFGNDGGTGQHIARTHFFARDQGCIVPGGPPVDPCAVDAHNAPVRHFAHRVQRMARLVRGIPRHHRLHRYSFHHQALALHQKSIALPVGRLKPGHQVHHALGGRGAQVARATDHQGGVRAFVAHMHTAKHRHCTAAGLLAYQVGAGGGGQCIQRGLHGGQRCLGERVLHRLLADGVLVCQAHAIG